MTIKNRMTAFGVASALAIGAAATASAGPMPVNPAVGNAPTQATDIAWRGQGWGGGHGWGGGGWGPGVGIGAGIAAGALIGSAVAGAPYGSYYYDQPVYGAPYAYDAGPTYVTPGYGYGYRRSGRCFTDEGYGRRTPCDTSGAR
jgi:hypothetical protein